MDRRDSPQFARLTTTSIRPDSLDTALQRFADTSSGIVAHEPGCKGLLSLFDRDTQKVRIITLWQTDEDRIRAASAPDTMQNVATFSEYWTRPLIRETYAVLVYDVLPTTPLTYGWYARVTRMEVQPEYWAPLIQAGWLATEQLRQQQTGYLGAIGLGDPGSGRAMFVELWDSRSALRASETTAYRQERTARAVRMLVGVPLHELYQVHLLQLQG